MKKKERKFELLKGILIFVFVAIVLSWLIPNGQFGSTGLATEGTLTRVGLEDLAWLVYYGLYYSLDKIVLLLAVGGLYGVLTKTSAYDRIVTGIANKLTHKKIAVVVFSVVIAGITSILTQNFAVVIFIPFIISIMNKMKLDKLTILATTFGSMLVGVMGATYGTEGLVYFGQSLTQYASTESEVSVSSTLLIRAGILLIGLILFNFFTLSHMNKVSSKEESSVMFPIEVPKDAKKSSIIPIIVTGVLLFVITILGYVDWAGNFGIEIFTKFHETLSEISIGDDFYIFTSLLGSNMKALGEWDLVFAIAAVVFVFTLILGLCYRVKFDEFLTNYIDGIKRVLKPAACVVAAYMLMVVVYMSPYVATIINKLFTMTESFNLATMSLSALITNIFHTDLGFTAYIAMPFLATEYIDFINPIVVIFISLYGFVQFFIPTSAILGVGLTALDVKYTDWLKYIWRFLVGMIICLLVIFILMTVL